ncbi:hypothetical protein Bxe_A2004 [Paraburkholderia xenovorans LB400]|uniref:Uncharacterized protein n=1 Tax=Paraburkholderia xenovorans (strain LB400) TaxID=266265 RepID=Q13Y77_PARXL|nr:hypothetical protein Bxe_A2004 [Paraburkholderia xenovorans LB400]
MRKSRRIRLPTFLTWKQSFDHLQSCTHIAAIAVMRRCLCTHASTPHQHSRAVLLSAPAILSCGSRYVHRTIPLLYQTACLHTHTLLPKARTSGRFLCPATFFINARHKRSVYTNSRLLHVDAQLVCRANLKQTAPVPHHPVRQRVSGFVPHAFASASQFPREPIKLRPSHAASH